MCPPLSIATVRPLAPNGLLLPFSSFQNLSYPSKASLNAITFMKVIHQPLAESVVSFPSKPDPADACHLTHEHFLPLPDKALSFVRMEIPRGEFS